MVEMCPVLAEFRYVPRRLLEHQIQLQRGTLPSLLPHGTSTYVWLKCQRCSHQSGNPWEHFLGGPIWDIRPYCFAYLLGDPSRPHLLFFQIQHISVLVGILGAFVQTVAMMLQSNLQVQFPGQFLFSQV